MTRLAQQGLSLTSSAVSMTAQTSGKAAYQLIRPKKVEMRELVGLWRLDQQLDEGEESTAMMEVTLKGLLVPDTNDDEEERDEDDSPSAGQRRRLVRFRFIPATAFKTAKLEFEAPLFDGPCVYMYRAHVHRKLADPSVIKLKGKMYRIERSGWRGKSVRFAPVGTFVARRRLSLIDEDDWEEESDEENEYESGDWEESSDEENEHEPGN